MLSTFYKAFLFSNLSENQYKYIQNVEVNTSWASQLLFNILPTIANPTNDTTYFIWSLERSLLFRLLFFLLSLGNLGGRPVLGAALLLPLPLPLVLGLAFSTKTQENSLSIQGHPNKGQSLTRNYISDLLYESNEAYQTTLMSYRIMKRRQPISK